MVIRKGAERIFNRMLELAEKERELKIEFEYAMEPVSTAYFFMGQTRLSLGFPDTAKAYMLRAIEEGEKTGHSMSITLGYTYLIWLLFQLGEFELLWKYYQDFINKYPDQQQNLWVFSHLKMCGECAEGRTTYPEQYVSDILGSGQHFSLSWYEAILATTYLKLGEVEKEVDLMERSVARSKREGDRWTLPMLKRLLAEGYLAEAEPRESEAQLLLKEALEDAVSIASPWFELEILASLYKHFPSRAIRTDLTHARERMIEGKDSLLIREIDQILFDQP
jgi:tetratricopeptide (TPR) repeat protein